MRDMAEEEQDGEKPRTIDVPLLPVQSERTDVGGKMLFYKMLFQLL